MVLFSILANASLSISFENWKKKTSENRDQRKSGPIFDLGRCQPYHFF